jgi:hypothetical protein
MTANNTTLSQLESHLWEVFVQSEKFVKAHGGLLVDISCCGLVA